MATLIVMIIIWVVMGALIGVLAGSIWKGERPYGENGDYIAAVAATLITGFLDWYVIPLLGMDNLIRFIAALTEPPLMALFVLWAMRRFKRR
jgi:uncharacterized membrane protein YeaQ/YmgE (transglycosylase-associated protein family)